MCTASQLGEALKSFQAGALNSFQAGIIATGEVRGVPWVHREGRMRVDGIASQRGHGDG